MQTKLFRAVVLACTALGITAAVLCFVPSLEVYEDTSDCFGRALSSLFALHDGAGRCASTWTYLETTTPVDEPVGMALYFLVLVAPGLLLWKQPRIGVALAWTGLAVVATFTMIIATFKMFDDWGLRIVALWPARLYGVVASTLVFVLIVVVPIACGVLALVARRRPPPPPAPELPPARVVSHGTVAP